MHYKDHPDWIPVGGRLKYRYLLEVDRRNGQPLAFDDERIEPGYRTNWTAKTTPVRELPYGRRTIKNG